MIKDNKALLFERMQYLNPDFKKPLTEGMGIGEEDKKDDKWIQKAVNPEHKGDCTPMTKETCTPPKKALAKRFKKGIENEGEEMGEEPKELSMEEKYENLVKFVDSIYAMLHGETSEEEHEEHEESETPEEEKAEHEEGGEEYEEEEGENKEKKPFPFQKKDDSDESSEEETEEGGEKKSFLFQKKNESAGTSAPAAKKIPVVDIAKVGK